MKLQTRHTFVGDAPDIETSITEGEALALYELAQHCPAKLEIGAAYGFSTILMALAGGFVVTVDPHTAHDNSLHGLRVNAIQAKVQNRVVALVGRSNDVLPLLFGFFDLVFIDGDHRHAQVCCDIWAAQRVLSSTGRIVLHDYDEDSCPGVREAVQTTGIRGEPWRDTLWISLPGGT